MTNINNNGFTKSSRGSDNVTVVDPNLGKSTAPNDPARAPSKSRFAEHLASSAPKPNAATRPTPQPTRAHQPRPATSAKGLTAPQDQVSPPPSGRAQPRSARNNNNPAPWERAAPRSIEPDSPRSPQSNGPARTAAPDAGVETARTKAPLKPMAQPIQSTQTPALAAPQDAAQEGLTAPTDEAIPLDSITADSTPLMMPLQTPETAEEWQQRLQEMIAVDSPELFMQQSPALALLAGRLEFVEPSQLPAAVSQSPLLQAILGNPQTAEVLQTALPLDQSLQVLGLAPMSPSAKNAGAVSMTGIEGQMPQPMMKLADTLEALGFETKRMIQEGDLLKDNISLDGLQSYMQRAERLQSTLGLPVEWPTLSNAPAVPQQQKSPVQTPVMPQGVDPALMAQLSRLAPQTQVPMDTIQLWSQNPERPEMMPLTVLDDGKQSPIFLNPKDAAVEAWDPFSGTESPLNVETNPLPPTMDEVPLVMNVLHRAPTAAQDPFLAMAQRWNTETLQTLRPEDFVLRERKEPPSDSTAAFQSPRSLDDLLNFQLLQAPDFNNAMDTGSLPTPDNASFDINSLQLSVQDLDTSGGDRSGDMSGRQQDQSFMNQDTSSMFAPTPGSTASNKAFSVETAAPQAPSAPVSPQQLQDILDKSSMLIKDGGGSIRLDLGSKEMGSLDLALEIRDQTVELRIVAHSEQAREALVQELPKLRESLQNQNLNLEKVEIGLSYGSSWSQSSGNGQQNREQFFENTSESSSRGPQGLRSTSRSYRQSLASAPEARVPLHNGLIQVRV